ncbi:hypothetical protein GW17_00062145 [Ensete ventricosum]|nr:hypothetical protein GW17_00062145 [Ensete ventricosum]
MFSQAKSSCRLGEPKCPSLNRRLPYKLCKGQGGYYLTARAGFRVEAAPSNNKGWKSRFMYISHPQGREFGLEWSCYPINNAPPYLTDEDSILVGRLNDILSSSRMIRNLTEQWLVKAGLSPAPREAFGKRFAEATSRPQKKVKASDRHRTRHAEGGSKPHSSKGKE